MKGTRRECLLIWNDGPDAAKEVDADAVLAPTGAACRREVYCFTVEFGANDGLVSSGQGEIKDADAEKSNPVLHLTFLLPGTPVPFNLKRRDGWV